MVTTLFSDWLDILAAAEICRCLSNKLSICLEKFFWFSFDEVELGWLRYAS